MDDERRIAQERHDRGRFSRTNTPHAPDADELGIAGETAFAWLLGYPDYRANSTRRTPGYQFIHQTWKIKVQTSRTPLTLLVKEGAVNADIYVLAGVRGAEPTASNVYWMGWMHRPGVLAAPVEVKSRKAGYTLPTHGIAAANLLPMTHLIRLLGGDLLQLTGRDRSAQVSPNTTRDQPSPPTAIQTPRLFDLRGPEGD